MDKLPYIRSRASESGWRVNWSQRSPSLGRIRHSWRKAFLSALDESNPDELPGRIEYAITTLERRYAEWGSDPGTSAELNAIQEALSALGRLMHEELATYQDAPLREEQEISDATRRNLTSELGHIRHLFLVLGS
jgi:hypothetical protein